jgi:hypothetical protein
MIVQLVAIAVFWIFTYLRVEGLVKRRRALGRPALPDHMPLLAGMIAGLLVVPVVWLLPDLRAELLLVVGVPLAVGFGVGVGVRSGMRAGLR